MWTFTLVLWPVVPLVAAPALAYYAVSFLIDRPNMLTILEPLPPSSGAFDMLDILHPSRPERDLLSDEPAHVR